MMAKQVSWRLVELLALSDQLVGPLDLKKRERETERERERERERMRMRKGILWKMMGIPY
jgi:hypothetical protein